MLADNVAAAAAALQFVPLPASKDVWLDASEGNVRVLKASLVSLLEFGNGEALVLIGKDSGGAGSEEVAFDDAQLAQAEATLASLEVSLGIEFTVIQVVSCERNTHAIRVLVRRSLDKSDDFLEVRVAVVGNVDSGKSTLLGVLTQHDMLDDGRGLARLKLFRHKHEIQSGRTSSIGMEILGFSSHGRVVQQGSRAAAAAAGWSSICHDSSKVINFIDLAGHEKYLKTTVFGLTGHAPDYCMLTVGANMGLVGMTREHLGLATSLQVPFFVVVTKTDICPDNVLTRTLKHLHKLLKIKQCNKMPMAVGAVDDVIICATNFFNQRLCPIFQVSNVTGRNLDLLRMFLNLLPVRSAGSASADPEFQIDDLYNVVGIGTVVSGIMWNGVLSTGQNALLGPDRSGQYLNIVIKSIHRKRMPVGAVHAGQSASFAIKKSLRKGMMILTQDKMALSFRYFEADVEILHHPTTIKVKYQAMVHVGAIRQAAQIIGMSAPILRTRDRALVTFAFLKNAEYLKVKQRLIFREGRTKAIGTITKLFADVEQCVGNAAGVLDDKVFIDIRGGGGRGRGGGGGGPNAGKAPITKHAKRVRHRRPGGGRATTTNAAANNPTQKSQAAAAAAEPPT